MELSIDSLSVLTMWQVASQRTNDPREHVPDTEATVFLQPSGLSDISLLLPYSIY